ncbi:MAG: hypothetical protein R6X34_25850 [Chloroflexota bacterium]
MLNTQRAAIVIRERHGAFSMVDERRPSILHDSALAWAKATCQTDQVVVAIILEEGDEPDRYLALIAAANQTGWQAAEVWLEDGRVVAINDLGEGIPPDDAA